MAASLGYCKMVVSLVNYLDQDLSKALSVCNFKIFSFIKICKLVNFKIANMQNVLQE